jgi:uncharacterized protein (TIGR02266 family)
MIGVGAEAADSLSAGLLARGFACEATTFEEGFELLEVVPYDAVVARFPFPRDLPMTRFMTRLRKRSSACRHAALALLSDEFSRPEAEDLTGRGANLVFPAGVGSDELARSLERVTGAAVRVPLVTLIQLEVPTESGSRRVAAQCENVSESGMFVRMDQSVAIGTKVGFELVLPREGYRLRGQATVVRYGQSSRKGQPGVALRLAGLDVDARRRLGAFVDQQSRLDD